MVLISAHRGGVSEGPELENSRAGLQRALGLEAEYVEFDVQRCADGTLVLAHDGAVLIDGRRVAIATLTQAELAQVAGELTLYEDALRILARHKLAHIDLKFSSPPELYGAPEHTWEVQAAQLALAILGDGGFLVTSLDDRSVRAIREWAVREGLSLRVGLSFGRSLSEVPRREWPGIRASELMPARRILASHANLVVAHRNIARLGVARWAARLDLPLLIWTVDDPATMRRWLASPLVWLLTTNRPELACQIRAELSADPAP